MAQRGLRTEATFEAKQLGAGAPGTVPQIVESRIVPRQRGDTIPCASCWKGFLPPTSPRSGNAIFRTGLFVGMWDGVSRQAIHRCPRYRTQHMEMEGSIGRRDR